MSDGERPGAVYWIDHYVVGSDDLEHVDLAVRRSHEPRSVIRSAISPRCSGSPVISRCGRSCRWRLPPLMPRMVGARSGREAAFCC